MSPATVPATARPGRRPGDSGTRAAIEAAARAQFAARGYERSTMRGIARDAGVDAALVAHFFGSKERLFAAVVELPFDPSEVIPRLVAGERADVGRRFATFLVSVLDDADARARLLALVRAAATEPGAADAVRTLVTTRVVEPLVAALGVSDAGLRAGLLGSQIVGLVMVRHVVGVEPLAGVPGEQLVEVLAPTLQRYLTEPLRGTSPGTSGPAGGRADAPAAP